MMAAATRGNQELNNLRDLVGSGHPLPQTDLPSLRDILRACIYLKEMSLSNAKQQDIRSLSKEMTGQVISVYSKASRFFMPGVNMIKETSIVTKIEKDWKKAVDIVNNKGKNLKDRKEAMIDRLDKIYDLLLCQCSNIQSCSEKGCDSICKKGAHIECTCSKEQKIPVIELLFVRDQRARVKDGLMIGLADHRESRKMAAKVNRRIQDKNFQTKKAEEQRIYEFEHRVVDSGTLDINENFVNNDEDTDKDFVTDLKRKTSQNRIDLTNTARESLRNEISVRATASILTAFLIDIKLVTEDDTHLVIDPQKVQRAREKVMKNEVDEAYQEVLDQKLECIFFDGRRDKTKMIVVDEDGDESAKTEMEEHYTLTDPYTYLTHVTPEEGTGAKGTADKIVEYLMEVNQLENVKIIGGDSTNPNTGWRGGAIHHIEVAKNEKVLWDICLLHTNELPLRHVMKNEGMETTGANSFRGEIGDLIKDEVNLYEVNEGFEVLNCGCELREIPEDIVTDLSKDQKYLYRIVKMIVSGELNHDVLKQVIGPVNHSRWLTIASRLCRLWVSKHNMRRNSLNYKSLKVIVSYIVSVYAVMWFEIKCRPNILQGPHHVLKAVQLVEKYCPVKVKGIVEEVMQRGAWHGHSENLLLSMLGSDLEEERKFAVDKIKEIRGDGRYGDLSVREFHVPLLNFKADSLASLIDMSDKKILLEPVLTCPISTQDLDQFIEKPFPPPSADCHTQSCERAVKETTIAAGKVYGFERRDGYIRAKIKSRKLVPAVVSKKSLVGMLG